MDGEELCIEKLVKVLSYCMEGLETMALVASRCHWEHLS